VRPFFDRWNVGFIGTGIALRPRSRGAAQAAYAHGKQARTAE
jgi:hypothetical protein